MHSSHPTWCFLPSERRCVREPPAGQGAGGRVQADGDGEGQPREHAQCQAGNYGHRRHLQPCRQEGGQEREFLPWPKTRGAFTHSVSDSNPIPRKYLGITRRGLLPHPQQRTRPVGFRASPKSVLTPCNSSRCHGRWDDVGLESWTITMIVKHSLADCPNRRVPAHL